MAEAIGQVLGSSTIPAASAAPRRSGSGEATDESMAEILSHTHESVSARLKQKSAAGEFTECAVPEIADRWRAWCDIAARLGKRYTGCTLSSFMVDEIEEKRRAVAAVNGYVSDFTYRVGRGEGAVFFGPPGTGKDHLMVAMIREACKSGYACEWINGLDFFGGMRDRIDGETSEARFLGQFARPDILAISDPLPPWGALTEFQAATLFRLIDRRYRDCKPIWVTINVATGAEASDRLGAAVVDRLKERALVVHCNWPSYRGRS